MVNVLGGTVRSISGFNTSAYGEHSPRAGVIRQCAFRKFGGTLSVFIYFLSLYTFV